MDNYKIKNIAFWILIILIIVLGIYLIWFTRIEAYKCLSNPYTYSVNLLEQSNRGNLSCTCIMIKSDVVIPFGWDAKGFKLPDDMPLDNLRTKIK